MGLPSVVSFLKEMLEENHTQAKAKWSRIRMLVNNVILGTSLLFLLYIIYKNWGQLQTYLKYLNYWLLVLTLLLYPLGFLPLLMMWHKIMSYVRGCTNFYTNIRLYSLSCLPKRLPGTIWYISSRVALYHEYQVKPATTLIATFIETICLTLSGFSIFLLSMLVGTTHALLFQLKGMVICLFLLPLAFLIGILVAGRGSWSQEHKSLITNNFDLRDALLLLGISALAWTGGGLLLYILSNAVTRLPVTQLPSLIGIWSGTGALSLSVGLFTQGLGLREMALTALLSHIMPLPAAAIVSILFRLLLIVGESIWALVAAWLAHKVAK